MRLEQFDYLIAVDEYHSMNKASENIFVSQQSISAAIFELEQELGVKLVYRTNKGSFLTDAGKQLIEAKQEFIVKCKDIVKQFDLLEHVENETKELHLILEYTLLSFYENIYMYYVENYPSIKLTNAFMNYGEMEKRLQMCPDAIGILCLDAENYKYFVEHYDCVTIKTLRLALYVSKNSFLSAYKTVSISNIHNHRILLYSASDNPSSVARILQPFRLEQNENTFLYNITAALQGELAKYPDIAYFAPDNLRYDSKNMPFIRVELKEKIPMYLVCAAIGREIPDGVIQALKMS